MAEKLIFEWEGEDGHTYRFDRATEQFYLVVEPHTANEESQALHCHPAIEGLVGQLLAAKGAPS